MAQIPVYTTGGCQETHEFIWKVENNNHVQSSVRTLEQQKFVHKFTTKSGVKLCFQVGYKAIENGQKWAIFLRLVDMTPIYSDGLLGWSIQHSQTGNQSTYSDIASALSFSTPNPGSLEVGKEVLAAGNWTIGAGMAVDSTGAKWWKMKLNVVIVQDSLVTNFHEAKYKLDADSHKNMMKSLGDLRKNVDNSDVKITCSDGKVVHAHKLILEAQNPVFSSMLNSQMAEHLTGEISVEDISSSTMEILLHYIYTGELLPTWNQPDVLVEFTYAAGKYQLMDILEFLDNVLGNEKFEANEALLLSLANKLSLKKAEAKLMGRVLKMANAAKTADELNALFSKV